MTKKTEPRSLADVLRAAADVLDAHPDLPAPYITTSSHRGEHKADLSWYLTLDARDDLATQKALAGRIVRAIDGHWEKIPDTYQDFVFRQERPGLRLDVQVEREAVCQRIVTGTETVAIPAKPAEPMRVETREVVEWRCEPLLAEVSR